MITTMDCPKLTTCRGGSTSSYVATVVNAHSAVDLSVRISRLPAPAGLPTVSKAYYQSLIRLRVSEQHEYELPLYAFVK